MRNGLLAAGNWIVDHVKIIDRWPAQDTLASICSQSSGNGGSPYNIVVDLANLGAAFPLAGAGLVGDDDNGRSILADCRARGIEASQLRVTAEAPTSYTDVMTVRDTGRRTFFHQRGANAHFDIEHVDFSTTNARLFHLGYLLLLDRLDAVTDGMSRAGLLLERAQAAGLRTSIDCVSEDSGRFPSIVLPALPFVDVLFANDFEAEKLTGIVLRENHRIHVQAVVEAARRLLGAGVRSWVVIHFPEAVLALHVAGAVHWQPSVRLETVEIAGAAGAGDALAAGILYGLHEAWDMRECLHLGVCSAAASLTHPTCSAGVQSLAKCLEFAKSRGFNSLPT
ncbi:MAG: carbohydrate kinase family protein [Opitutaceae bacterium]|nr:carbohydrate kinase family protein [Opitutaceae bacterium]